MIDRTKVIKGLGEALVLLAEYVPGERYLGYSPGACLDAIEMLKAHVLSVRQMNYCSCGEAIDDTPTCGSDYCEIGGDGHADG